VSYALHTLWEVISTNWIMMLVLVGLLVFKVLGPRLRRFWRGGF